MVLIERLSLKWRRISTQVKYLSDADLLLPKARPGDEITLITSFIQMPFMLKPCEEFFQRLYRSGDLLTKDISDPSSLGTIPFPKSTREIHQAEMAMLVNIVTPTEGKCCVLEINNGN